MKFSQLDTIAMIKRTFFLICIVFFPINCFGSVKMKKLILIALLGIPILASAYRLEEPTYFSKKLVEAAIERTNHIVRYDGAYRKIRYPNGDVPDDIGVCTDLIIRSYRKFGSHWNCHRLALRRW
jgi:hypothetical protein